MADQFDPDAYLAEKAAAQPPAETPPAPAFDPDAYLAGKGVQPETPKPSFSLPTSWEDAFHRVMGSGLLQTPTPPPTDAQGKMQDMNPEHMLGAGDVIGPGPGILGLTEAAPGVLASAGMVGGSMAADSAIHGDSASDIVQNGLVGAGASLVGGALAKTGPAIGSALEKAPAAIGGLIGHHLGGFEGAVVGGLAGQSLGGAISAATSAVSNSSTASAVLKAAAQQGPQQAAIAHYLLSQRDPAYAAAHQKKDGK